MAKKGYHPGRRLIAFGLGVVILYGLVAMLGNWKPELGLDLQGGTRIQLQANGNPSSSSLNEARKIIDQRVNGTGVAEAEVTTQSNKFVVVEIPGKNRRDLIETVERQAQLRFRLVACGGEGEAAACAGGDSSQVDPSQLDPNSIPQVAPDAGQSGPAAPETAPAPGAPQSGAANRPGFNFADETPSADPSDPAASDSASPAATDSASPAASDGATPGAPAGSESDQPASESPSVDIDQKGTAKVEDELAWMRNPTGPELSVYQSASCTEDGTLVGGDGEPLNLPDDPNKPLVACSEPEPAQGDQPATPSSKYLLTKSVIEGTELDSADAGVPQGQFNWVVNLKIGGDGRSDFSKVSRDLFDNGGQFAVVLDGKVLSAPTMDGVITNGEAQISGNFTESSANSLATSLKYGALPISFSNDPTVEQIGPSLAGNQLSAGITAGAIGLGLVMIYCLIYYRGLGLVVLASLVIAAIVTYAVVLLLGEAANFTLTLPGIAGLIVGVGVTADSFIVYFERIRDEMREGKSMRVAVESGWKRARNTALAADAVSLLAAIVLFIFAIGVVKGFAFALGVSTLIDLAVFFWFTKPMVSWLAKFKFFNRGHRMSGLDAGALGVDSITLTPATAGGKA